MNKNLVLERHENERPAKVLGPTKESVTRFARNANMPTDCKVQNVPLSSSGIVTKYLPVISKELEIAAARSILLSFEHSLIGHSDRFTRLPNLQRIRELVRDSVKNKSVSSEFLHDHSLGIQLEKMALYSQLRAQITNDKTPFEHFMLVAGSLPQRCIDAVWVIYGFEPYGFRLCRDYTGPSFCFGLSNPVIKGEAASSATPLDPPEELLCRPTRRRTSQSIGVTENEINQVVSEIINLRTDGFNRAHYLVNTSPLCESWQIERFKALLDKCPSYSMFDLLQARLQAIFSASKDSPETSLGVTKELTSILDETGKLDQGISYNQVKSNGELKYWASAYRECVKTVTQEFGMPGGGYARDPEIKNNEETWRRLGIG